jgi:polynucleotide 5'-hydroxyl-kinase GRC3/NOL9
MVIGASDSGKTTWVGTATRHLIGSDRLPFAIVDADVGQSTVGPPSAVGLTLLREQFTTEFAMDCLPCHGLSFIGSVSPPGHLLQILVGTNRLVESAVRWGARTVLVDTTGLIDQGPGFQLKLRKIELLAPRHLVALQRDSELEPILTVVAGRPGLTIHRLEASPAARARTALERARYRADRLMAYFSQSRRHVVDVAQLVILAPSGGRLTEKFGTPPILEARSLRGRELIGLVVGLQDSADETLALGVFEGTTEDIRHITIRTPLVEPQAIRIVQLGSLYLEQ